MSVPDLADRRESLVARTGLQQERDCSLSFRPALWRAFSGGEDNLYRRPAAGYQQTGVSRSRPTLQRAFV